MVVASSALIMTSTGSLAAGRETVSTPIREVEFAHGLTPPAGNPSLSVGLGVILLDPNGAPCATDGAESGPTAPDQPAGTP